MQVRPQLTATAIAEAVVGIGATDSAEWTELAAEHLSRVFGLPYNLAEADDLASLEATRGR